MKKIIRVILIIAAILAAVFVIYILSGWDNTLTLAEYQFDSDKTDKKVKLAFLSDLHCSSFGEDNSELFDMLSKAAPDAVLLGGDMFDDEDKIDVTIKFLDRLTERYTVYAVMGNHEYKMEKHTGAEMKALYREHGVSLLENGSAVIEVNGEKINICGMDIPSDNSNLINFCDAALEGVDTDNYTVMLFHRPEIWEQLQGKGIDLALSGHAHGGQWRVPGLINGVIAPNQGLFPKYAGGLYEFEDGMSLVVSRGLATANTIIPRVYNPPELILITIK